MLFVTLYQKFLDFSLEKIDHLYLFLISPAISIRVHNGKKSQIYVPYLAMITKVRTYSTVLKSLYKNLILIVNVSLCLRLLHFLFPLEV